MIKRALLAVIALASTAAAAYTLNLLDQIVHGTLYNYELRFSYDWANPYWYLLRIIQVLLAITIATMTVHMAFTIRTFLKARKQRTRAKVAPIPKVIKRVPAATRNVEKAPSMSVRQSQLPSSTTSTLHQRPPQQPASKPAFTPQQSTTPRPATPSASPPPSNATGPIKCPHCGRSFTQPLRMLDFQGDRPRIVEICPFCNETMRSAPRAEEKEQDRDRDRSFPIDTSVNHSAPKTMTQ